MEPRIQYAKTKDGVNIAFWTLGEGVPLVHMSPMPLSHGQLEWQFPELRQWYERLAQGRKLVRYDVRGAGLSDRKVTDFSLDALVLDLEAVVLRLGLERFALFGPHTSGPVAIAYAARHPDRVSHLLLWCSWARAPTVMGSPQAAVLRGLMDQDWSLFTETFAHVLLGWSAGEQAQRAAAVLRECVTQETCQAFIGAISEFDVTELLPEVRSPTLVLYRRLPWLEEDLARGLASAISDARLAVLEGTASAPYLGDMTAVVRAIGEFVGGSEEAAAETKLPTGDAVHTIVFTDMQGSTALTQRLGDAKAQELVRAHNAIVREALSAHGGSEIKHTGDGIMASFPSASGALECAITIQRAVERRNKEQGAGNKERELAIHIGLNAGEPLAEDEDLFGTAVQLARRICDHAEGGQILASNVVRELVAGKGFLFSDIGEVVPKGFEEPVRLYEVRWQM